jgi:hypothetical protein
MLVLFGLGAAAAVGGVLWWSQPHGDGSEPSGPLVLDEDGAPIDERSEHRRRRAELQAQARNMSFGARDDDSDEDGVEVSTLRREAGADGDAQLGDGSIDRPTAEAGFDHIMGVLEEIADDRERLAKSDWRELYRAANDAFSALSMHLDADNPADLERLEQAHRRLQDGLRRVRVRGRKFAPD